MGKGGEGGGLLSTLIRSASLILAKFDSHDKGRLLPTVVPDPSAILIKVLQPYPVVPEAVRIFLEEKS